MTAPAPTPVAPAPGPAATRVSRAGRAGVAVLAALVGGLLLAVVTGQVALARITTASMAPALPIGSVVVGRPVTADGLRVGDVLTAHVASAGSSVTHRVVAVSAQDGRAVVRTRGDANDAPDPWTTVLPSAGATRVVAAVPHLGHVLARGPGGVPLLALPLLVLATTWAGCTRLLTLLAARP